MMAKSLVRNRHAVTKMYGLKSQLQAVSLRIAVRRTAVFYYSSAICCCGGLWRKSRYRHAGDAL